MKRISSILLIGLFAYILSGCTYWTMNTNESQREVSVNETIDKEEYIYTDDFSDYKKIDLNLNIDVSDVTIKKVNNQTFTLTQHANKTKLFVIPTSTPDGDTLHLSFDSPKHQTHFNTLNSKIVIELPESFLYNIHSNVDVGKFELNSDTLHFEKLDVSSDVGDINIILASEQDELKYVDLSSDVGKVNLELQNDAAKLDAISLSSDVGDLLLKTSGAYPTLQEVEVNGNTGKVTLSMNGNYDNAFTLDANSDIGQVKLDLKGDYAENTKLRCTTSTGGLKLKLDENLKVKLIAEKEDFISKIKFQNVNYTAQEDCFFINNANSDQFDMTIEAYSDIGDIEIYH
ncbi:DUF4097 family beta strand repeat-containing protein [Fusibacter ferrireducens]|uniref:Adhesin domain-containing protein n=1 Tax=Fusibacter ferrireducens TaxID=2785058 RepID=A0ABR9ZPU3_9FIRM|nr:hypothetical protein [Fusibacter ferrireducens]MBF4691654.1 hypothetical protein [Fusibacter ferrireducens]